jgi:hypothetical protein
MRERLPISRRHPWVGAPPRPVVRFRAPSGPSVPPTWWPPVRGLAVLSRLPRQGQAPRPRVWRVVHPDRRTAPTRRGWCVFLRPRNPGAAVFQPVPRFQVWLTYESAIAARLTHEDHLFLDLAHEDTLSLTLTDQSHAG